MLKFTAFRHFVGAASVVLTLAAPLAHAQTCPFDNGGSSLENDGLVLTRYALGLRGAPMVANTAFAAGDAATIENNIACPSCGLRVTDDKDGLNNPIFTVADATIISRKIAGFAGPALTNGIASLGTGTRNTPAAVQSFLLAGCGATGGTVTNITAGTGLTGGTITDAGVIAADTTYLQRRVAVPCGTGSYITAIAADGTPSCGTPSGGGTVTSVATGAGLTGGPISVTGSIALAGSQLLPTATCGNNQTVIWSSVGGNWICAAYQPPSAALPACAVGELVRVGGNGSLQCSVLPNTTVTLDAQGAVGSYNAVAMPSDGLPVVAYYDASTARLQVAKCASPACLGFNTSSDLGAGGLTPTIAISADGFPIIAHIDGSTLKVVKCSEPKCAAGNAVTSVTTSGAFADTAPLSMVVPVDGRPAITHPDSLGVALKFTKCGNAACSAGNVTTVIDGGGSNLRGAFASVAVPSDGFPVIAYTDDQNSDLKIAKCSNSACSAGATLTTVDSVGNVGKGASIAIGLDGLPVVSYVDSTNSRLRVVKCGNAACNASNSINVVESDPLFFVGGTTTSITIPADGLPIIGYVAFANSFTLRVAKCSNSACSGASIRTWPDANTTVELPPGRIALAVGADGLPAVSYYDHVAQDVKLLKCSNAACRNP
jgi:hypothetical protein